ncbi:RRP15-like protein [Nilaparvata lugens]|uniref:RRP15-like protein n=1 Tax=Nilaparvata lugens TaxID=108931 RepID=UPI00193CD89A|nr:RRP15-like protein [Nilaparvata lugens]
MKKTGKTKMVQKPSETEESFESAESDNNIESEREDDNDAENNESKIKYNPGWADAMAKILRTNKPKRKKTIVLSKAKKLKASVDEEEIEDKKESFVIEAKPDSNALRTEEEPVSTKSIKLEQTRKHVDRIRKKDRDSKGRFKPSILEKDREKILCRIATKGVVQLFNAVRDQQKTIEKKIKTAGSSDSKQEKVLKSVNKTEFLNTLMKPTKSQLVPPKVEEPAIDESQWSVLRDDFMMSTKLKDWDKGETT